MKGLVPPHFVKLRLFTCTTYTLISMNLFTQDEFDVMKVRDGYNIRHYDHYMRIPCDEAGRRIFTPQILFD